MRRREPPARVAAAAHNDVLAAATARADDLEERFVHVLERILAAEGRKAATAFRARVTDHLTASAGPAPAILLAAGGFGDVTAASAMVCVRPRAEEAAVIADPGGAPPETLHVTLAALGEVDEAALGPLADLLRPVAAALAPLVGVVGGYGRFEPPGVGILLPDVPGLVELRVAVTAALAAGGVDYYRNHGFQPHITVDGNPEPDEAEQMLDRAAGLPLHFDALEVVRGDEVVLELPLVGVPPLTAAATPPDPEAKAKASARVDRALRGLRDALEGGDAAEVATARASVNAAKASLRDALGGPAQWTSPAGSEMIDADALARTLRTKTDPVRQALVATTMTPALAQAGLSFDVSNPLTAQALASTGAHIQDITDATRANVMRIVQASYEQGLSIDDTAKAISFGMAAAAPQRARVIARTELVSAVNGGSLAATKIVAGATGSGYVKKWLVAPGAPHPRHELYDGLDEQEQPLDGLFDVGGAALRYPGDPQGPPEEIIQCRCAMVYVEASGDASAADGAASDQAAAADDSFGADVGVTPFRAGEDQAAGFYESDKFSQFVSDVHDSADSYGVTVDGLDHVTGVWQGETEPSVSLRIHDGEKGVRAYAANLGHAYNQDGVLIFADHAAGDVMATYRAALPEAETSAAMSKAGIDAGRFTADGRLQVIGSGPEFVKQLDALAADLGPYDASVGRFELLERDAGHYGKALREFGPPKTTPG